MALVKAFQMPLDDCRPIIIHILQRPIWNINERYVVQVPLFIVKASNIGRAIQEIGCL